VSLDWIAKIIEDKNTLLKKCEDIFCVITDKTDILDFLWNHVWDQVGQNILLLLKLSVLKSLLFV